MNLVSCRQIYRFLAIISALIACSCAEKVPDERFSSPLKVYEVWLQTAIDGDMSANLECLTGASLKFMDRRSKSRELFIARMAGSAKVFRNYSVENEKIKDKRAVVMIVEPKSGNRITVPFLYEEGEWKVDLIAMFGG